MLGVALEYHHNMSGVVFALLGLGLHLVLGVALEYHHNMSGGACICLIGVRDRVRALPRHICQGNIFDLCQGIISVRAVFRNLRVL